MLPSDEEEILRRVEERFIADEGMSTEDKRFLADEGTTSSNKKKSIGMPTALTMVLMESAREDIANARREPRRFTRREATRRCMQFIAKDGKARRGGPTAKEPSEGLWTRTGERAIAKLCMQVFHDPESGADVRFVDWEKLPPPSRGVKALYCVKPTFTWPSLSRPIDPFELAALILGYAFVPASICAWDVEPADSIELILGTPFLAVPAALQ